MYYKIGSLAKRFGITPQALRFYEQHGLLVPERAQDGTARRYQARNLKWLYSIRRYHELGFSLDETLALFSCETPEALGRMVTEKQAQTERALEALTRRLKVLRHQETDLALISRLLCRCEISVMPQLWLIIDQTGQDLDLSPSLQNEVQRWMHHLPWVYAASVVESSALLDPDQTGIRKSGFCVEASVAADIGLSPGAHAVSLGGGPAIHTVACLRHSGGNSTSGTLLDHALVFAKKHGLTINADTVGRCLAKTREIHCQEDLRPQSVYYEYWLPIEQGTASNPSFF